MEWWNTGFPHSNIPVEVLDMRFFINERKTEL
jgi:hypothetical protein